MSVRTKARSLYRKALTIVSAPFRTSDHSGWDVPSVDRASGETITADTAMQLSVVFSCVRLIAETIATLPLIMYQRKNGGGRAVAADHPLYSLLHDSPNADHTAVEFWEIVVTQLALRGRSYVHKSYDTNGNLFALNPLHPDRMGTPRLLANGGYVYPYNHPTRGAVEFTESEIWQIRGYGGMSVIQYGAKSMGSAMATERAASRFFGNDMKPAFVTIIKDFLTKDQRRQMKEAIADGVGGSTESGRFRLLEGGPEFKQLALSPEDSKLLETRSFTVEELCRWFGVPPAMVGHGTAVSNWGTGREQINLGFLQYVLRPYLKRLEQGIYKSLLRPEERRRIYAEFSVEGLLRADSAGRAAYYATMVQNAIMKPSECRDLENLPPDESADVLVMQSNMIPLSALGAATTSPDAVSAIDALKRALGIEQKEETP